MLAVEGLAGARQMAKKGAAERELATGRGDTN
jgi:hypothetical protein